MLESTLNVEYAENAFIVIMLRLQKQLVAAYDQLLLVSSRGPSYIIHNPLVRGTGSKLEFSPVTERYNWSFN